MSNFIPKYPTEFFLEFRAVDRFIYRVSDLYSLDDDMTPEVFDRLDRCHLYLLCTRPRLSLVPGTLHVNKESLHFEVDYKLQGRIRHAVVEIPRHHFLAQEETFEISTYPHRELITRNHKGEIV